MKLSCIFTVALKIVGLVISLTLVSGAQYGGNQRRSFQTSAGSKPKFARCEYYNKTCIHRSKEDSDVEIEQCYGQKLCEIGLNQEPVSYTHLTLPTKRIV